ncbi:CBS domain-containing protein [Nocardioides mangrovi]|uniref:CBS domain-containing protein n=1 Tax=Nocardioides mangrovi TaxID=2874580 RepID=A0ABS7UKX2_9ACTN|nr:CBS domain-containing protein [Nocardioides mangrovi]MBZ5741222.1 CBS domain-containing protein [Nocardioides mangrovi]
MTAAPSRSRRVARVRDAMTSRVVAVDGETSIGSAIDGTLAVGHTHVVIVDGERRLLDVIPVQLLSTALLARLVTRSWPVGAVTVADPLRITADALLADAVAAMLDAATDAIGVVDEDGRLVGILTWPDVGRHVAGVPSTRPRRP